MGFKQVQSLDADNVIALGGKNNKTGKANLTSVEGYYVGSRKVESKKAKKGFAYIHILQTNKGNLGVWGKTNLDQKLLLVTPGTMVKLTFTGTKPTPNGPMYVYKVEQDTENTIEVDDLSAAEEDTDSLDASDDGTGQEDYSQPEEEQEEEVEEAAPPARPALSASSRASRREEVKNMIGKRK